jgi:hypothetical protein
MQTRTQTKTKMNHYTIKLGNQSQGIMRAKNAQNALVNWLRLLSATHHIPRGSYASARYKTSTCTDSYAVVYLWQDYFQVPVFATARETANR